MGKIWAGFCGLALKALGWTTEPDIAPVKKCVILGVPHTSFWDFAVSYLYYASFGKVKARVMIKKELFFWPLGPVLKALGAVPVDRRNATAMLKSVIDAMNREEVFHLAIAPEGTRKPVKRWKTGYHTIASAVGCPVYMGYFDWRTKKIGVGKPVELTGDARADTERIQALYAEMELRGKHPENYVTG